MSRNFFIGPKWSILKSRKSFFLGLLILIVSCNDDEIQLPKEELQGQINGESWNYKSANAYLISSDFQYRVRFLSDKETVTDPCTLPNPSRAHIKAVFRPSEGSFFVAPQALDKNQVQVSFEISPSKNLIASSGYMEIFAIEGQVIIGFLQAVLDDENTVEGSFEIRVCN